MAPEESGDQTDNPQETLTRHAGNEQGEPPAGEHPSRDGGEDGESIGPAAKVGLVLLGIVLVVVLVGANGAIAADRTVLDADHVVETFEEEGVFASLTDQFRDNLASDLSNATVQTTTPPGVDIGDVDSQAIAEGSVTESYIREEMGENIRTLYAFLHGERDDVPFVLDLRPVKESVSADLADSIAIDTPELVGTAHGDIDEGRVAALEASEQEFQSAQRDMSDAQREQLKSDIEAQTRQQGYSENVTAKLVALQFTVVDGLAGDLDYETYNQQRRQDERALAEALAAEQVGSLSDELALTGEGQDPSEAFSGPATMTQRVTMLTWLLPLVALVLVGLAAVVSRSFDRTAATTGWALLVAGVLSVLVGLVFRDLVVGSVRDIVLGGDSANPFVSGFFAVIESFFGTVGTQGIGLTLGGLLCIGLAMADRRGYFADVSRRLGITDDDAEPPQVADPHQSDPAEGDHAEHQTQEQRDTGGDVENHQGRE